MKNNINDNKIINLCTHDGIFHADEVMAIALKITFEDGYTLNIIRTRDTDILDKADILVDAGGKFDGVKYFDHHQYRKDDKEYGISSAGMIWNYLNKKEEYPLISKLIHEIDDQDTGIKRQEEFHFCNLVSLFNSKDINGEEQNDNFKEAIIFAITIIEKLMIKDESLAKQKKIASEYHAKEYNGLRIIVLNKNESFIPSILFQNKTDIVVQYDKGQSCWTVQILNDKKGSFKRKFDLEPTKEEEEIFCHNNGFIGKYKEKNGKIKIKIKGKGYIEISIN